MKNLLIKLSLIIALVVACGSASAAFTDNASTLFLYHCDSTNANNTTPDDNSSGRTAHDLSLNWGGDTTMMPGVAGNNYLHFDGDDQCTVFNVYDDEDVVTLDCSFRVSEFPPAGEYRALMWTVSTRIYLVGDKIRADVVNAAGNDVLMDSTKALSLDTWYTVRLCTSNSSAQMELTVDDTTDTMATPDGLYWAAGYTYFLAGWDVNANPARNYTGDLDEMRATTIPEPFTFGLIGLVGFLAFRRRK